MGDNEGQCLFSGALFGILPPSNRGWGEFLGTESLIFDFKCAFLEKNVFFQQKFLCYCNKMENLSVFEE